MQRKQEYARIAGEFNEAHIVPVGPAMRVHILRPSCWCEPDYQHDETAITTVYLHYPRAEQDKENR